MPDQFDEFIDDVLDQPPPEPKPATQRPRTVPVVTTPMLVVEGHRMAKMCPALTAVRCYGTGFLQSLSANVRDLVGGRATVIEQGLAKMITELRNEISATAAAQGAHAVLSFHVEFGQLDSKVYYAVATGTPVILEATC
jgi:uncharacterized protein YbjQ (UPF0145 family)